MKIKNMMSALVALGLATSLGTMVVCCGDPETTIRQANQSEVDHIKAKISAISRPITISKQYLNLSDYATIAALNQALAEDGIKLSGNPGDSNNHRRTTSGEWSFLSYQGTLRPYVTNRLAVIIKIGSGSDQALAVVPNLPVHCATRTEANNYQKCQKIYQDIVEHLPNNLYIPNGVNRDTRSLATKTVINQELSKYVPLLGSPGDATSPAFGQWAALSYEGQLALPGIEGDIKIIIQQGECQAAAQLVVHHFHVTIAKTNLQIAQAVWGKLAHRSIIVPSDTNPDATLLATRQRINDELRQRNLGLTYHDVSYVTYEGVLAAQGVAKTINGAVIVGNGATQARLVFVVTVTIAHDDQSQVTALAGLITKHHLILPYGHYYAGVAGQHSLLRALQRANPHFVSLPPDVVTSFNPNVVLMEQASVTAVNLIIKLHQAVHLVPLEVQVNNSWSKNRTVALQHAAVLPLPKQIGSRYFLTTFSDGLWTAQDPQGTWTANPINAFVKARIFLPPVKINGVYYLTAYDEGLWFANSPDGPWQEDQTPGLQGLA